MRSSRVLGTGKRLALIAEPETWSQPLAKGLRMHHRSLSLWTFPRSPELSSSNTCQPLREGVLREISENGW